MESSISDVVSHLGYISSQISAFMEETDPLSDIVQIRIDQLNFYYDDAYLSARNQFIQYTGNGTDTDGSDVFYNYKNTAHPSKQYHPYLRNMVEYDTYTNNLLNTYTNMLASDLDETRIVRQIDNYIGHFGESINFWKNTAIDYTGYSSRYESSNHKSETGVVSEFVDYDGGFHPDAVKKFIDVYDVNGDADYYTKELSSLYSHLNLT